MCSFIVLFNFVKCCGEYFLLKRVGEGVEVVEEFGDLWREFGVDICIFFVVCLIFEFFVDDVFDVVCFVVL